MQVTVCGGTVTVEMLLDSLSPYGGRATTFRIRGMSLFAILDMARHRLQQGLKPPWQSESWSVSTSRTGANAAALQARDNAWMPPVWRKRGSAPLALGETLDSYSQDQAEVAWMFALQAALKAHARLKEVGVSDEIANCLLAPFRRYSAIVTGTDWDGFFAQRAVKGDGPGPREEVREIALAMRHLMALSVPVERVTHLPLVTCTSEEGHEEAVALCVARCARTSTGTEGTIEEDIRLFNRLKAYPHEGPFEHALEACDGRWGPYQGWKSVRELFWPGG